MSEENVLKPGGVFPIAGGVSAVDDKEQHNSYVAKLKEHISKLENDNWDIIQIDSTSQQVVGGMKYYFDGKFKNKQDGAIYQAKVWLYERAWENHVELGIESSVKLE